MESQEDNIKHLSVTITCPKCQSNEMQYNPELGDESPVTCNACGESLGKLSEAKQVASQNALNQLLTDEAKKAFEDAFRGESGAKFESK